MLGTHGVAASDHRRHDRVHHPVDHRRRAQDPRRGAPRAAGRRPPTSRAVPELVFDTDAKLDDAPRQQQPARPRARRSPPATTAARASRRTTRTATARSSDLPAPPAFITCRIACETTDERFTRDGSGTPIVIDTPQIPFTVVIPKGTPPPGGWPVIIQQHGLGGQRDTVVGFGEAGRRPRLRVDRHRRGGARLPLLRLQAGRVVLAGHRQQLRRHGGPRRLRRRHAGRLQRELPHRATWASSRPSTTSSASATTSARPTST